MQMFLVWLSKKYSFYVMFLDEFICVAFFYQVLVTWITICLPFLYEPGAAYVPGAHLMGGKG